MSDGLDATGTDLLAPNYVSPRSLQMNVGLQHEMRPGMVFTVDYLRNIETHTLLAIDTNHVGDARFFITLPKCHWRQCKQPWRITRVRQMQVVTSDPGPAMVSCYIAHFNNT